MGEDGKTFNINADLVAGHLAAALGAEKLILLTDVAGVMDKGGELISSIRMSDIDRLKDEGVIAGGMLPKLDCCAQALARGVAKAHIIDGRNPHALLLELFTDEGIGTQVLGGEEAAS